MRHPSPSNAAVAVTQLLERDRSCLHGSVNAGAKVGQRTVLISGCTIDQDVRMAAGTHVSPRAHLRVALIVGEESWIGFGAAIR